MSVNSSPLLLGDDGYQISRSVRLRSSATAWLTRPFATPTNSSKWTMSMWVKRGSLGTLQGLFGKTVSVSANFYLAFNTDSTISWTFTNATSMATTQVFRDPSAWYHVVAVWDSANATASLRARLYVNGAEILAFSTDGRVGITTGADAWNTTSTAYMHAVGAISATSSTVSNNLDGYLTEVNFIDGQALTPASFGQTDPVTGVWGAKKYLGTYGTNGFYLNFSDPSAATAAAIGKDSSGNGNNWTPNNISVTAGVTYDSMLDVPTMWADGGNGRGNYCTLTPLPWRFAVGQGAFSNGNLNFTYSGGSSAFGYGTIGNATGKWYFEGTFTAVGTATPSIGIADAQTQWGTFTNLVEYSANGQHYNTGANWSTYTAGDIIGVAFDLDGSTISFYKNNTLQGTVSINSGVTFFPLVDAVGNGAWAANFGQRPFAYTPPTGFKALNTQNLPDSTIKKGNTAFDVSLYTGNGTSQSVVNSGGFQPDLVWVKSRSSASYSHRLFDSIRGVNIDLQSNTTNGDTSEANSLTAFNSNGYSVGSDAVGGGVNTNAVTYVGWQWKKGAAQGFDIVTYTGTGVAQTIAHSLGVAPKMYVVKSRSAADDWVVYHASLPSAAYYLTLDTTNAQNSNAVVFNSTAPTSTVFSVGTSRSASSTTYVAYLFSEVAGFSKFGSYTGNGSADGPFVYCGFRPRFVMIKRTDTTEQWRMWDTARDAQVQPSGYELYPNLSNSEAPTTNFDYLSNGFKLRAAVAGINASGGTYIFAAFAENPFKNSLAR
jgi:Concanavalin A-like lectin/glucanases superfamily/SPRY domain